MYAPWCPFCTGLQPDFEQVARDLGGASLRVAKYNADEDRDYCKTLGLVTFPTIVFMPRGNDKVRPGGHRFLLCVHQRKQGNQCAWFDARVCACSEVLLRA